MLGVWLVFCGLYKREGTWISRDASIDALRVSLR